MIRTLRQTIDVDLKTKLGRLTHDKEILEQKLKKATDVVKEKTYEMQQLVGRPMDPLTQREEREDQKSKQIDSLVNENVELNLEVKELTDKLFRTEERLLDLKFEKETFDLQYARLQKRITDLENYKLQSSQMSAVLKQ